MAGFFGLFNYGKEGPGVAKNAPEKRGFVRFFEIYSRKFWNLALAGLMWFATCVPLLTRGLADAGLTFITRSFTREKHAFVREDFAETIRKNWRPALVSGIINQLITGVLLYNILVYTLGLFPELYILFGAKPAEIPAPATMSTMDNIIIAITLMVYGMFTWMKYYIPFLLITFKLNLKQIYKNAFFFSAINLKRNLLISVVLIAVYLVLFGLLVVFPNPLMWGITLVLLASVVPAFRSFLIQYHIFPCIKKLIIDPYYQKHPDADKQLRRNLNLEVEEDVPAAPAQDKPFAPVAEEPVFVDTIPAPEPTNVPKKSLPKQYNEKELRHFNRQVQNHGGDDDDDTI